MFCPKCATANPDQAKFCRACGTNLEAVALALAGRLVLPGEAESTRNQKPRTQQDWLEKWGKGVREAGTGAILLAMGAGALVKTYLLFEILDKKGMEWLWASALFIGGGLAIWGFIRLVRGIPDMIESKTMLHEMERIASGKAVASTTPLLANTPKRQMPLPAPAAPEQGLPLSVTEQTTQSLSGHPAPYPDVVIPERQEE